MEHLAGRIQCYTNNGLEVMNYKIAEFLDKALPYFVILMICGLLFSVGLLMFGPSPYYGGYRYKRFDLEDGHYVMCIVTTDINALSCDWDRMK